MIASGSVATAKQGGILQVVFVVCVLALVFLKNLVDDGFCLPRRVIGGGWDVKVKIHGLLISSCSHSSFFYGQTHVQENHRLAGFSCGPGEFAIGE